MSKTEANLEKEQLVKLIKISLSWSESILRSFNHKELSNMYDRLLNREKIYKAKVSALGQDSVSLYIPKDLREKNSLTCGDRCNVKLNLHKKELYLDFIINGKYKILRGGNILLPYILVEKKVLKPSDDSMLIYDNGRLTVKSFSYM